MQTGDFGRKCGSAGHSSRVKTQPSSSSLSLHRVIISFPPLLSSPVMSFHPAVRVCVASYMYPSSRSSFPTPIVSGRLIPHPHLFFFLFFFSMPCVAGWCWVGFYRVSHFYFCPVTSSHTSSLPPPNQPVVFVGVLGDFYTRTCAWCYHLHSIP